MNHTDGGFEYQQARGERDIYTQAKISYELAGPIGEGGIR
jgi:hypothetical protein